MQNRRRACWLVGLAVALLDVQVARTAAAQRPLPELLYTCPMHADVLEDAAGTCPICKMKLEAVRIETEFWYACPIHAATLSKGPGACPLDKRQKMPVVVTVHWVCSQSPDQKLMEPGQCADGTAPREIHQIRAHGDHNPRHGGQFYMASDNWHHVEGAYPRQGLFRVFFYDNFSQPIDASRFTARLLDDHQRLIALKPGAEKNILEGALGAAALPVKVALEVTFDTNQKANHFDFQFTGVSKEPQAPPRAARAAPVTAAVSASPAMPALTSCAANVNRTDVLLLSEALPRDQTALLQASDGIHRIVLSAWELDLYGDLGNQQKLTEAYQRFAAAVGDINAAYGTKP